MSETELRVGLVGVGEMGMPIAQRLIAAGYSLIAYPRRPEVREELSQLGADNAGSLHELAGASDIVIICVYTDDQVREVALGPEGFIAHLRGGSVVINHTTGRPATAEALGAAANEQSCSMLDAALSGGPADIAAGKLTLLVGGDSEVLDRVRPVLASYSSPILRVGAIGDGQKIKLLNNALFGAHMALTLEIETRAKELGVDPALALHAIQYCSGNSYVVGVAVAAGSAQRIVELGGRFIRKDVAVATDVAAELGVDLGAVGMIARTV